MHPITKTVSFILILMATLPAMAQKSQPVQVVKNDAAKKVDILIGKKLFTSFMYPDSLEKPVLYPVVAANGTKVTRGFPIQPLPGEPTDHPHHLGIWLNYESVNGLDFWNNSYAIPAAKKHLYGWIKNTVVTETADGPTGKLSYRSDWVNQKNEVLLVETTRFEFSGTKNRRIIDRSTTLQAETDVLFADVKDGFLGMRLAHELQIPAREDKKFTDDKGIVTTVKGSLDSIATGNYLTSEGKMGDAAWSTRAKWCKVFGKMGTDSVSIIIIDHPANPNFPTFWHARGYGLFAANPLGEKVFTNGKSALNLALKKGEKVVFRYRIVVENGKQTSTGKELEELSGSFNFSSRLPGETVEFLDKKP